MKRLFRLLFGPEGKQLRKDLTRYLDAIDQGADPIEALHGHVCGPDCWHQQMSAEAVFGTKDKEQ